MFKISLLNIQNDEPWAYGLSDSSTIAKNNIMSGKTEDPGEIQHCAPEVGHAFCLFSNQLLYWLRYLC